MGHFTRRNLNGDSTPSSFHGPSGKFCSYGGTESTASVATGMARGSTTVARAGAHNITTASPSPSLPRFDGADLMVSLREMKAMAQGLDPSHPFRILLLGEPDEIPRHEYLEQGRRLVPPYRDPGGFNTI